YLVLRLNAFSAVRLFLFPYYPHFLYLHSFPTRRSSDLTSVNLSAGITAQPRSNVSLTADFYRVTIDNRIVLTSQFSSLAATEPKDRKSTRLNSSHGSTSYAVFCLKKKSYQPRAVRRADRSMTEEIAAGGKATYHREGSREHPATLGGRLGAESAGGRDEGAAAPRW